MRIVFFLFLFALTGCANNAPVAPMDDPETAIIGSWKLLGTHYAENRSDQLNELTFLSQSTFKADGTVDITIQDLKQTNTTTQTYTIAGNYLELEDMAGQIIPEDNNNFLLKVELREGAVVYYVYERTEP